MSKIFEWLNTPKVKPSAFLSVVLGIIYYFFVNTTVFQNLSETWQTLIFIAIIVVSTLFGVSIGSLKQFSTELNDIIKDTKLNPQQKINELTNLAIRVNTQLGQAWESYNLNEPDNAETADNTDQVKAQIAQLEQQLRELGGE